MDGLRRVAGITAPIELNGKVYRTKAWSLGGRAEIESYIVSKRPPILDEVAKQIHLVPAGLHPQILDAAMRRLEQGSIATEKEVLEFLSTAEGGAYLFWQAVRDHHPEVATLADATEIVKPLTLGELNEKLQQCMGLRDESFTQSAAHDSSTSEQRA